MQENICSFKYAFWHTYISGLLHDDLQVFLESNVPKGGKKDKVVVGVSDAKIGAAITEELGIKCSHIGVVPEVIRGKMQTLMLYIMIVKDFKKMNNKLN